MSSYFNVELDTTPPVVLDLIVTPLVMPGESLEIEIATNEDISEHRVYITDVVGTVFTEVLHVVNPRLLSGFIDTSYFAEGPAKVVIHCYDEVRNKIIIEADIMVVTDGLTYCLHDSVIYSAPRYADKTTKPGIDILYQKPGLQVISQKPDLEILRDSPSMQILYKAPKIYTGRCHTI